MVILHGIYSWGKKVVAYRKDYCLRCEAPRITLQIRSFKALHILFVPLLPLGFWKEWHCTACGANPHEAIGTRASFLWASVVVLLIISLAALVASQDPAENDVATARVAAVGGTIAAALLARYILRKKPTPKLASLLAQVTPA